MSNFKTAIEELRMAKILKRFPMNDEAWVMKFWYRAAVEYTKGRTAAQIEKNIISYIKLCNFHAEKHSVVGREVTGKDVRTPMGVLQGKKTYIPSQSQKGSADITSTVFGLSVKIEVKKGKDRMSPDQKKYQAQIEAAGGFYFVAHDEEDFFAKFQELLQHPKMVLMSSL